jgi:O-methyltransferase domain
VDLVFVPPWVSHLEALWVDILRNCREAAAPDARVVLVEAILPPGDEPHFGKVLDVAMLVVTGGRERSEAEYAALLDAAGFRLERVVATASPMSVLEGVAV